MAAELKSKFGETAAHARLKRLALIWAQAHGYSICALEVQLPRCRFRADVAAYRRDRDGDCCAVFECKQSSADLRRDNCDTSAAQNRLESIRARLQTIERNLRVHYPTLRVGESLFSEFDALDFARIRHRSHRRLSRKQTALSRRLLLGTKFEKLGRYHCANAFYLVQSTNMPLDDLPACWGLLIENGDKLQLARKPIWLETRPSAQRDFLLRVGQAATRAVHRSLEITRTELSAARKANGLRSWDD